MLALDLSSRMMATAGLAKDHQMRVRVKSLEQDIAPKQTANCYLIENYNLLKICDMEGDVYKIVRMFTYTELCCLHTSIKVSS
jgi:hypothetical protein